MSAAASSPVVMICLAFWLLSFFLFVFALICLSQLFAFSGYILCLGAYLFCLRPGVFSSALCLKLLFVLFFGAFVSLLLLYTLVFFFAFCFPLFQYVWVTGVHMLCLSNQLRTLCVFFTINRLSARRHPAHTISVLILHPREISYYGMSLLSTTVLRCNISVS